MYRNARYLPAGDKAVSIEYGNEINEAINRKIRAMCFSIKAANITGIEELIPTYRSLSIEYNPLLIGFNELVNKLAALEKNLDEIDLPKSKVIVVPVCYGGDFGPDIDFVAGHNGMSVNEVIQIHTSVDYLIFMLGFTPGFPYLGGMSEKIETPRLQTPRTKIPAGSVGIAGKQTGVYPIESPGGWQLIGRTPLKLYDPNREPPIFLQAGDYIRFVPVTKDAFEEIQLQMNQGTYSIHTILK